MKETRLISYNFGTGLIAKLADILYEEYYKKGRPLNKVACVFGGKRPALFLKKHLSEKIKTSYFPPAIFSIDEFMGYTVSSGGPLPKVLELELYYLIWRLFQGRFSFLHNRQLEFSDFLSWAKEIVSFIEQLDLEGVKDGSLSGIQKSASIGYDIPESINCLLENIIQIRKECHDFLGKKKLWTRGLIYLKAAEKVKRKSFSEFDKVFFCGLYYLHKTESEVVSSLYKSEKAVCIFEGSAQRWPVLKENSRLLNQSIEPHDPKPASGKINFYEAFDTLSQVSLAAKLIKKIKDKNNTLILLPDPETLLPLLAEAAEGLDSFNVSLGYPLNRSSLYALFCYFSDAHKSKKSDFYYSRDYLKVLKHPFTKNVSADFEAVFTRILVHKIEEALNGNIDSAIGGRLFVSLESIESDKNIFKACQKTLFGLGYNFKLENYQKMISRIHELFFRGWEVAVNLRQFCRQIKLVLDSLSSQDLLKHFPLEQKAFELIYQIKDEFSELTFSGYRLGSGQIWEIFKERLDSGRISFIGSPLKGAQILGLFEARCLQFKNVLVLDANEGVLPKVRTVEPLIPAEVMMSLGLGRLQKEEEIQRYNFTRLVESAENVFLIWAKNQAQEKSRFIESLIWEKQKKAKETSSDLISKVSFSLSFPRSRKAVPKTAAVVNFLKNSVYSASRLNTYLECPLQFYYKYVLGLEKNENLLEEVTDSQVGNFIHKLLFDLYNGFLGKKPCFGPGFKEKFRDIFHYKYKKEIEPRMRSDHFLLKGIIETRLSKFLDQEAKREPDIIKVQALEKKYLDTLNIQGIDVQFKYIVDRIDLCRQNNLKVIDYKTGSRDTVPRQLKSLEDMGQDRRQIKDNMKSFQLPLYYYFMQRRFKNRDVGVYVYNLRTAEEKPFITCPGHPQKEKVLDCCLKALKFILAQIFDSKIPFEADRDTRRCKYCQFYNLCT